MAGQLYADTLDRKDYRVSPIYGDFSGLGKISLFPQKPFDFDEQQMAIYKEKGETETCRFINWNDFSEEAVTLPIDKIVAKMIKELKSEV